MTTTLGLMLIGWSLFLFWIVWQRSEFLDDAEIDVGSYLVFGTLWLWSGFVVGRFL